MSEPTQPLTPPSAPPQGFEPYQAPAYGQVAPEPSLGGPGAPYQIAPQFLVHPQATTHPLAGTALGLGIGGLVGVVLAPFLFFTIVLGVCSPVAIWLGVRARRQIRAEPQRYSGEGMATAGMVTGIVGTVLAVLGVLFVIAIVAFVVGIIGLAA